MLALRFSSAVAVTLVGMLIGTACGSSDAETGDSNAAPSESRAVDGAAPRADLPRLATTGDPAISPGATAVGQVTIGDTEVDYVTFTPDGFEVGDTAPVLLALPPGGQDFGLTQRHAEGVLRDEAMTRGWVVISPAAPNGELYFRGSEVLVPSLLDWVASWVTPEGGRPHVAGVSNGGISAFRLAGQEPDRFASILVYPGFPRSDADKAALSQLTSIPVRMFVGEGDDGWVETMERAAASLNDLGGDVVLDVVEGEGHVIRSLDDGVRIFDELDAHR